MIQADFLSFYAMGGGVNYPIIPHHTDGGGANYPIIPHHTSKSSISNFEKALSENCANNIEQNLNKICIL